MAKMTEKAWENSFSDKKLDAAESKRGIKEGSAKDRNIDRAQIRKINAKRKG
jgi:hypothetical protein